MKSSSLGDSFGYALLGVVQALRSQRNLRIHVNVALFVVVAGWLFFINSLQWVFVILAIGLVMSLELVNTAIEAVVDLASPGYHPVAKLAKDASAGAVLVAAVAAAILGLLIYMPELPQFGRDFMVRWHQSPLIMIGIIGALVVASAVLWRYVPIRRRNEGGQNRFGETH